MSLHTHVVIARLKGVMQLSLVSEITLITSFRDMPQALIYFLAYNHEHLFHACPIL